MLRNCYIRSRVRDWSIVTSICLISLLVEKKSLNSTRNVAYLGKETRCCIVKKMRTCFDDSTTYSNTAIPVGPPYLSPPEINMFGATSMRTEKL